MRCKSICRRIGRWATIGACMIGAAVATRGQAPPAPYYFTTLAGDATFGNNDGLAPLAKFNQPASVAADSHGNVFVADTGNNAIRKITPTGVVSTLPGLSAGAITVDARDNLYVLGGSLQRVTPDGAMTSLMIAPTGGGATGLAVASDGTVYLAMGTKVGKLNADGSVTTLAGGSSDGFADGTGAAAGFNNAYSVAFEPAGNLVVMDVGYGAVRRVTREGVVTTIARNIGFLTIPISTPPRFHGAISVAVGWNGDIFVADRDNNSIRKITSAGVVSVLAGPLNSGQGNVDATGSDARFSLPTGVAVDAMGNVVVADGGNNVIRKITPTGAVTTLAGSAAAAPGSGIVTHFNSPSGIARDHAGNLYVADTENHFIRKISPAGAVTVLAGSTTYGFTDGLGAEARFRLPVGVAVGLDGTVYVSDSGNGAVRKITPGGLVTTLAGAPSSFPVSGPGDGTGTEARFGQPAGIAVDADGFVYVADITFHSIRRITPAGAVTTLAGAWDHPGFAVGTGATARFNSPRGLVLGRDQSLFVVDTGNGIILKISPDGQVSHYAGELHLQFPSETDSSLRVSSQPSEMVEGEPSSRVISLYPSPTPAGPAYLANPYAIAIDAAGNLYVTDPGWSVIRKITPARDFITIGGLQMQKGNQDGVGSAARFSSPYGIAADETGVVYVTDSVVDTVRLGFPGDAVAKVSNLSSRGQVGTGERVLIAGFIIGGDAPKTVLLRAAGPVLRDFGVPAALNRPILTLYQNGNVLASNQGWESAPNAAQIPGVATSVGAFPFPPGSNDSAILTTLLPGNYSAIASGVNGTMGVSLVEVYDADGSGALANLRNISARGVVGVGNDVLIAGLIVSGPAPKKILLRGIGPTLGGYGVGGVLNDPQIQVFQSSAVIAGNSGWSDSAEVQTAGASVGAFPLTAGSKDAAMVVVLNPGNYTVILRSQAGSTGVGLVEAYEVPWF